MSYEYLQLRELEYGGKRFEFSFLNHEFSLGGSGTQEENFLGNIEIFQLFSILNYERLKKIRAKFCQTKKEFKAFEYLIGIGPFKLFSDFISILY